jgi:hypothetical protein
MSSFRREKAESGDEVWSRNRRNVSEHQASAANMEVGTTMNLAECERSSQRRRVTDWRRGQSHSFVRTVCNPLLIISVRITAHRKLISTSSIRYGSVRDWEASVLILNSLTPLKALVLQTSVFLKHMSVIHYSPSSAVASGGCPNLWGRKKTGYIHCRALWSVRHVLLEHFCKRSLLPLKGTVIVMSHAQCLCYTHSYYNGSKINKMWDCGVD